MYRSGTERNGRKEDVLVNVRGIWQQWVDEILALAHSADRQLVG